MPNIASALKQEIARVARREIRDQTLALRKASVKYRKTIAELRRRVNKVESELAGIGKMRRADNVPRTADDETRGLRFSAKSVISQRRRLGVSAADFGKLLGVTAHTVYKWEHGMARPRRAQLVALASVRSLGRREASARLDETRRRTSRRRSAKK